MERHALLVGINTYRPGSGIPALKYAESDATELAEALRSQCGFQCAMLLGQNATHDRIVAELRKAGSGELFVFFFAGHGEAVEGAYYLHPYDGEAGVGLASIDFAKFMRHWGGGSFGYAHCVAILDACRSSLGGSGQRGSEGLSESDTRDIVVARQRAERDLRILYGCDYGQCSHEFDELRHGVLTYHLVEVIRQRSLEGLTLAHLVEEASDRMRDWLRTHKGRALQQPQWLGTPTRRQIVLASGAREQAPPVAPRPGRVQIIEPAKLRVTTAPAGASITVNGTRHGQAPLALELPTGDYRVRAEKEGFEPWERMIRFEATGDAELPIELKKPRILAPRGWAAEVKRVTVATPGGDQETDIPYFSNALGMKFVLIPAGEFMMGDTLTPEEVDKRWPGGKVEWYKDAHPRHRVKLTQPFYLGAHQVTRGQFAQFVRETGYKTEGEREGKSYAFKDDKWDWQKGVDWRHPLFEQTDEHPVVCVSWNDAKAFCEWLSRKAGLACRLPTEAEWEYAARAGSGTTWYWGDEEGGAQGRANIAGEGEEVNWTYKFKGVRDGYTYTAPVGRFTPNAFGLYDMIGNVWEWCEDWYGADSYGQSPADDPKGPSSGQYRVLRGGSWGNDPRHARAAYRGRGTPGNRRASLGFRMVCVVR